MNRSLFSHLLLLALCASANGLHAQVLRDGVIHRKTSLLLNTEHTDTLHYFEIRDSAALHWLACQIRPENYPLSVVKKPAIEPFFDLLEHYEVQLSNYRLLSNSNSTLDSIQQLKIQQLELLNSIQNKRIDNYKQLADDMTAANHALNDQLTDALALAKDCNKGKVSKRLWSAAVGAGIGFTLAGLIAFLK